MEAHTVSDVDGQAVSLDIAEDSREIGLHSTVDHLSDQIGAIEEPELIIGCGGEGLTRSEDNGSLLAGQNLRGGVGLVQARTQQEVHLIAGGKMNIKVGLFGPISCFDTALGGFAGLISTELGNSDDMFLLLSVVNVIWLG